MGTVERLNETTPSVEADRKLLPFSTYEEYLDSMVTTVDLRNLQKVEVARCIAKFGYRHNGETLTEKEFYKRRAVVHAAVFPVKKALVLASDDAELIDILAQELALREKANRLGILSTIIFIRYKTREGSEVSGYIDYGHRLVIQNWNPFFKHNRMLMIRSSDLGYYHWRHGTVRNNISRNYMPIMDAKYGLLFLNRHDHKMVFPDPQRATPGQNTTRVRINSPMYLQCELFDHVVRKRC